MSLEKAKNNFLKGNGTRRFNCCEAVAYAFTDVLPLSPDELKSFAAFGGGKAPGDLCGAVYAAKRLLESMPHSKASDFLERFKQYAGSLKCREIKANKIACLDCVEKSAQAVEDR